MIIYQRLTNAIPALARPDETIITPEDVPQINSLFIQLHDGQSDRLTTFSDLEQALVTGYVFVARDSEPPTEKHCGVDQPIVGMATLVIGRNLTETFGIVEDVIVDQDYRGCGIGATLMHNLIDFVSSVRRCSELRLTSNRARTAARKLYKSLGFRLVLTDLFVLKLSHTR